MILLFGTVLCILVFLALRTTKDIYLLCSVTLIMMNKYFYTTNHLAEFILCTFICFYLLYLIVINYKVSSKLYMNKNIAYAIQFLSIVLLTMIKIDIQFHVMLVFGYFMLFRQERWHKHLYIMFVMICIIFVTTGGIEQIFKLLELLK